MDLENWTSFWTACRRSHLLPTETLLELKDELAAHALPSDAAALLEERGFVTAWQARQLAAGRHSFFVGNYRLLSRLGSGSMGKVFKAVHTRLDRVVAIKFLAPKVGESRSARLRFLREVRALASLKHPNIVEALDAGRMGELYFLVMEFAAGHDLAHFLDKLDQLPVRWACECIRQAALGLEHAHQRGLIHRDIKPSNLLVVRGPMLNVKLLDLGMARYASSATPDQPTLAAGVTQMGQLLGTVDYMSPEQARNPSTVDIRSDIYSLGCTLFKLLTGTVPFRGFGLVDRLIARVLEVAPPPSRLRPGLPAELDAIVARMLARDPADRYETPGDVARALSDLRWPLANAGLSRTLRSRPSVSTEGTELRTLAVVAEHCDTLIRG